MEEVQEFLRELSRVHRILRRDRLRRGLAWWLLGMAALLLVVLSLVGRGVAPNLARWGLGFGVLVGIFLLTLDLWRTGRRLRDPVWLGARVRDRLPGIRHAIETLCGDGSLPDRFARGASPALIAAEARRAASLLRQTPSEWFLQPEGRRWPGRVRVGAWMLLGLSMAWDFWGVSRGLGGLLGLPGGPGGAWWAGPPRIVDVVAYDLRLRIGSSDASSEGLVPWIGDAMEVAVPQGAVVEVSGRLFGAVGALEMVMGARSGKERRIPVPVTREGTFSVACRIEEESSWYLAAWAPPGRVVQESTRRRFRISPPSPPSLEMRPSGWYAGTFGEVVAVSWEAQASPALGAVEARYRHPWSDPDRTTGILLRRAEEGGRRADGVFPVTLSVDLLDQGGRMDLWVEGAGAFPSAGSSRARSGVLHLFLDAPLPRLLVRLERVESLVSRTVDLLAEAMDLPGPGDPFLPVAMQENLESTIREVRGEADLLRDAPDAMVLRTTLERAVGMLAEPLEAGVASRQRVVAAAERTIGVLEDLLARERLGLVADLVAELDRFGDWLAGGGPTRGSRGQDGRLRLRAMRWQVAGLEVIRLLFLQRTLPGATGRRMALMDLKDRHQRLREALDRMDQGSPDDHREALEAVRRVGEGWRRLFAEGALVRVQDILLPSAVREDLRKTHVLQVRVAERTGALAARVRARIEQRETVPPERVREWQARLETAVALVQPAIHPRLDPLDLEDLQSLERQLRFLSDLLEAGDMDKAASLSQEVLQRMYGAVASFQAVVTDGGFEDPTAVRAYRRALAEILKAVEEVRAVYRTIREVVSSGREMLAVEERSELSDQAQMQREVLRVFGRVSDFLSRVSGAEGSEVSNLAQGIRGAMREAVDRLGQMDVLAVEAYQQKTLMDLARLRSLLSRRDLDSYRAREPRRFFEDLRLADAVATPPSDRPWTAEVRKRLRSGVLGPDPEATRSYYESLLAP